MKKVLVIGDVMIDTYHHVETNRKAQEADIPIYDLLTTEHRLGGAANVAANIKALDSNLHVTLSCIADGDTRTNMLSNSIEPFCAYGLPIRKTRFVDHGKIVARLDDKKYNDLSRIETFEKILMDFDISSYDLIVISDYDKGTVTERIARKLIESNIPVIVDSKRKDLRMFRGAKFLNINLSEFAVQSSSDLYTTVEELFESVIVTRGSQPTWLIQYEKTGKDSSYIIHTEEFPVEKVKPVDVTGCGDTHAAAFAVGYLRDNIDIRNAVRYANQCAAIAVTKQGTTKVTRWDFLKTL